MCRWMYIIRNQFLHVCVEFSKSTFKKREKKKKCQSVFLLLILNHVREKVVVEMSADFAFFSLFVIVVLDKSTMYR